MQTERLYFLDWLRILALGLLIFYHVGMYYVVWPYHVKSPFATAALAPWMVLSEPWRMSLIFMISGAALALLLRNRPPRPLIRQRAKQLLLPLLCGMVLIVPPQSYFEVQEKFAYAGSYFDFLKLYFTRYRGFCESGKCLILPTWNHLWFLPYLWIYSALVCLGLAFIPRAMTLLQKGASRALCSFGLIVVPILLIAAYRFTLHGHFPKTYAVAGDWYSHALYGSMFLLGWLLAGQSDAWPRISKWRWPALVTAIGAWAILVGLRPPRFMEHIVISFFIWTALLAAFGFAYSLLNQDHPLRKTLTQAVFPVYIFHQTILFALSQWLKPFAWNPGWEAMVIIALTFSISYGLYWLVRPIKLLRPWLGLRH